MHGRSMLLTFAVLLGTASFQLGGAQIADEATAAINMAADYILHTELFKGLAQVDLPAEINLPGYIKIVNLRISGLDNVSRSCDLQLRPIGDKEGSAEAEAKTCVQIHQVAGSFEVKVLGQPLVLITIRIADFRARATLRIDLVPGGAIRLDFFDARLSPIEVTNHGLVGDLVSHALQIEAVREQIRLTVATQLGKKIGEALNKVTLPA